MAVIGLLFVAAAVCVVLYTTLGRSSSAQADLSIIPIPYAAAVVRDGRSPSPVVASARGPASAFAIRGATIAASSDTPIRIEPYTAIVRWSGLNLRTTPTTDAPNIVLQIGDGARVTVLAETESEWLQIEFAFAGQILHGFVKADGLTSVPGEKSWAVGGISSARTQVASCGQPC